MCCTDHRQILPLGRSAGPIGDAGARWGQSAIRDESTGVSPEEANYVHAKREENIALTEWSTPLQVYPSQLGGIFEWA